MSARRTGKRSRSRPVRHNTTAGRFAKVAKDRRSANVARARRNPATASNRPTRTRTTADRAASPAASSRTAARGRRRGAALLVRGLRQRPSRGLTVTPNAARDGIVAGSRTDVLRGERCGRGAVLQRARCVDLCGAAQWRTDLAHQGPDTRDLSAGARRERSGCGSNQRRRNRGRGGGPRRKRGDRRECGADGCERGADGRERGADGRERGADGRERGADGRERGADGRERGADGRECGAA